MKALSTFSVLALALALLAPPAAWGLVGDSRGDFGLDGSFRLLGAVLDQPGAGYHFSQGQPVNETATGLLRLTASGRPGDRLAYEVHTVQSITTLSDPAGGLGRGGLSLPAEKSRYRAVDDTATWLEEPHQTASLWADRAWVRLRFSGADLTLGRQALTFGKAWFWNPTDVFLPFDALSFDRDYKGGVDALLVEVPLGPASGLSLAAVAGRNLALDGDYESGETADLDPEASALLARGFMNVSGWDFSIQAGRVYHGWHAGAGAVGDAAGFQVRAEAAVFRTAIDDPLPLPLSGNLFEDRWSATLGLGRRWPNSLDLEAEYLFNSGGDENDLFASFARVSAGALLQAGRHFLGVTASYELTPLVVARLAWVQSLSDGSGTVQPFVNASLSDNAELVLGLTVPYGPGPSRTLGVVTGLASEFGSYPNQLFGELKWYF
ncbi:MAG: hypothetical protein ABIM40_04175 [Pseudomonadota bacterium]